MHNRLLHLYKYFLLITFLTLSHAIYAANSTSALSKHKSVPHLHHITLIYSKTSSVQTDIMEKLSTILTNTNQSIQLSKIAVEEITAEKHISADVIVAIGIKSIKQSTLKYPGIKKLFIAISPGKYRHDINIKNASVLYMTQPYCRQLLFIKLINSQWHRVSYLSDNKISIAENVLLQCAKQNNIKLYKVDTDGTDYLTEYVKNALRHSDVLLALPDKTIYNSETVKSILLTSYRLRKPIFAFSKNFTNAGALASIYSTTDDITKTAVKLIKQLLNGKNKLKQATYHPQTFNISINKQVFRALDIDIPDLTIVKQKLVNAEHKKIEKLK